MKFGIEKIKTVIKTDIKGNTLQENISFVVYRSYLFGLGRLYVKITPKAWKIAHEVRVDYCLLSCATEFETYEEAESLIEHMEKEPSKFVRYK